MNRPAPRSIDDYLAQLREALAGEDPALVQDALYDAEEYLRAELAASAGKSEADMLELIASTYGAPTEVADAYRETEARVRVALAPPRPRHAAAGPLRRFFGVFGDVRAWTSLFFLLLTLPTGVFYFTLAVTGLSISLPLLVFIIGVPLFLAFIGLTRVIALGEGRLIEAMTGERMPRRPPHPGAPQSLWQRAFAMLRDLRTWSTLAYFMLSLPIGVAGFVIAVVGLALGLALPFGALWEGARLLGLHDAQGGIHIGPDEGAWTLLVQWPGIIAMLLAGVLLLTLTLHVARLGARAIAWLAKSMLVMR
ncbi:MAG: sensor domain-containing protein [Steroidobacteraceae bacterium]